MIIGRASIVVRVLGSAALGTACAACSLTDPFDGYSVGERTNTPEAGLDADATPDALPESSQCEVGFASCEGSGPGCETDLMTSIDHCGSCAAPCAPPSAEPVCVQGQCTIKACTGGRLDCDQDPANGCETDPESTPAHCGACGKACPEAPNADPACTGGSCSFQCRPGYGDCDSEPSNGCEVDLTSTMEHCGVCSTACDSPSYAIAVCEAGVCSFVCQVSHGDCDSDPTNGCETNLWTDPKNCSACGVACSSTHGTPGCNNAHCTVSCESGFGDCDNDPDNGCETDLVTDPLHCSSCDSVCPLFPNAAATCSESLCGFACQPGRADCNLQVADGCEADLWTEPTHCGSCGHSCGEGTCVGGLCSPILAANTGSAKAHAIAVDSSWIYFTDSQTGRLYRVAKPGDGSAAQVWDEPGSGGEAIAQDAQRVYYATSTGLRSKHKLQGDVADLVSGYPGIKAIASDGTNVYWVTAGSGATEGIVARVGVAGGTPVVLASNQARPAAIALAGGVAYWTVQGTWTGGAYNKDGALLRASGTVVAANQGAPTGVAASESYVFWVNSIGGTLMKAATSGGSPQTLLSNQSFSEDLVVVDSDTAYWVYYGANAADGTVMRADLSAVSSSPVAIAQPGPRRVAVDATHVYWTVSGTGSDSGVYRVVR